MKRVGIVGLGIMGAGMAGNFLDKGYEVYVYNRNPARSEEFAGQRARVCRSPAEVAANAEIIFEITANDDSSKKVWLGKDGILAGATPDCVLVASSTLSAKWIDRLADECENKGYDFFDMALTGGRIAAEGGKLVMLVGGDAQKLEELKPALAAISQQIIHFGPVGHGMRYKLLLNMLQAIHITGFGEVMQLAEAAGMDTGKVADALAERPGGATTMIARSGYHNQPDPITFSIKWITKDLDYARKFAGSKKTPLLDEVLDKFHQALEDGKGDTDWTNINE